MPPHILMGAINKETNKYEYPKMAEKPNKFMCPDTKKEISKFSCPDCGGDVQLKKGAILAHHFAHYKSDNPCKYYEHPGESQIHKDAKLALKTVLESGEGVQLFRKCNSCKKTINTSDLSILNQTVKLEYPFMYNNSRKIADIACVDGESIKHIFEICHKHKTSENDRPEPWSEIDARKVIENINTSFNNPIKLNCMRDYKCHICISIEEEERERKRKIDEEQKERELKAKQPKTDEEKEEEKRKRLEKKRQLQASIDKKIILEKQRLEIRANIGPSIQNKILEENPPCINCKTYIRCKDCKSTIKTKFTKEVKTKIDEELQIRATTQENPQSSES